MLSVLLDDAAIRVVILDSGVAAAAPARTIHVCMSSISTGLARDLARTHAEHGGLFAAASMFGRPEAAANAKLEIVTAGPTDILDKVRDGSSLSRPHLADGGGSASRLSSKNRR